MAALVVTAGILASLYIVAAGVGMEIWGDCYGRRSGVCLLSLTYSAWFTDVRAVVVRTTFCSAAQANSMLKFLTIFIPGIKLYLKELEPDAPWAKVVTSQGETGFIPVDRLGTI